MLLMEIRAYLQARGAASLDDLANHFRIAPDALRGMLGHWIAKGMVVRGDAPETCGTCPSAGSCGGCTQVAAPPEIYRWTGPAPHADGPGE